jgi:hypothetical protein
MATAVFSFTRSLAVALLASEEAHWITGQIAHRRRRPHLALSLR